MKELTANFDHIYLISVPHQMPCRKLTFWSDQEIIDYANEKNCDADIDNVADAIDIIKSDWNSCKVIRNIEDCFYAWRNAAHKAGEIRAHIIDIIAEEVDDDITDYEAAQAFFDKIAENKNKD